ncbi:MAG: hypothetical protein M1470_08865 [Bacteroidetes bacterium]|nr:hypothetical protein [Bacteroidota bacterium]MCL5738030.1 hypothetical protein [Bacteroidota bacterium]
MKRRAFITAIAAIVLIGVGFGAYLLASKSSEHRSTVEGLRKTTLIAVDQVVSGPEKFTGLIGVNGSVSSVDESKSMFTLGCEDACVLMPVKFDGQLPEQGTNVVAYGKVEKNEQGKYIFVAQELKTK